MLYKTCGKHQHQQPEVKHKFNYEPHDICENKLFQPYNEKVSGANGSNKLLFFKEAHYNDTGF